MIQQVMTSPGVIEFREIPTPVPGNPAEQYERMRLTQP